MKKFRVSGKGRGGGGDGRRGQPLTHLGLESGVPHGGVPPRQCLIGKVGPQLRPHLERYLLEEPAAHLDVHALELLQGGQGRVANDLQRREDPLRVRRRPGFRLVVVNAPAVEAGPSAPVHIDLRRKSENARGSDAASSSFPPSAYPLRRARSVVPPRLALAVICPDLLEEMLSIGEQAAAGRAKEMEDEMEGLSTPERGKCSTHEEVVEVCSERANDGHYVLYKRRLEGKEGRARDALLSSTVACGRKGNHSLSPTPGSLG